MAGFLVASVMEPVKTYSPKAFVLNVLKILPAVPPAEVIRYFMCPSMLVGQGMHIAHSPHFRHNKSGL